MSYSEQFYADRQSLTQSSTSAVLDVLLAEIAPLGQGAESFPQSVLDVGCATGIWLAACKSRGVTKVHGIDGPWVPREQLEIAEGEFTEHNLAESMPAADANYDLALCIEVAEHLAATQAADLVNYLAGRADMVLFSAAIPGQGGTDHINEQPQSYWREHFANAGMLCFDIIRPALWSNPAVNLIYRQNMLLYVAKGSAQETALRQLSEPVTGEFALNRVHPELMARRMQQRTLPALLRQRLHDLTLGPLYRLRNK